MTKESASGVVEVEFQQDYIASRGPGISGAKGTIKSFRMSPALQSLLDEGVVKLVKGGAKKRETATAKNGETS